MYILIRTVVVTSITRITMSWSSPQPIRLLKEDRSTGRVRKFQIQRGCRAVHDDVNLRPITSSTTLLDWRQVSVSIDSHQGRRFEFIIISAAPSQNQRDKAQTRHSELGGRVTRRRPGALSNVLGSNIPCEAQADGSMAGSLRWGVGVNSLTVHP